MKLTKEEMRGWMLEKVQNATNPYDAECWLLTARTLGVDYQVEESAYRLHCQHKNVSSAAETLQRMYMEFSSESRFWDEIMRLIDAVKDDAANDETSLFRRAIFQSLLPDLQQTVLLELAEKQTEKVEQCRFLLLLLRLFPDSASTFGMQLIEVLTDLEKNAQAGESHENVYTQLLVCDVLPILLRSPALKLTENLCLELFKRAVRFYLSVLSSSQRRKQGTTGSGAGTAGSAGVGGSPRAPRFRTSSGRSIETPAVDYHHHHQMDGVGTSNRTSDSNWESLLQCFAMIAERCRWEVGKKLRNFRLDHLQNVLSLLESSSPYKTEALFTALLIFLSLVFKYSLSAGAVLGREAPNTLVALVPPFLRVSHVSSSPQTATETGEAASPAKIAKKSTFSTKDDSAGAVLTPSSDNDKTLMEIFTVGKSCMKLLGEGNRDELIEKLLPAEKHIWVKQFVRDSQVLNGEFRRVAKDLEKILASDEKSITTRIQLASCYLAMEKTVDCAKTLLSTDVFDSTSASSFRNRTFQPFASDNWHFAFISEQQTLEFSLRCATHILGRKIMEKTNLETATDQLLGHAVILSQYEWPKLNWLFTRIMGQLSSGQQKRTKFSYPKFFSYVHRIDILEEVAHLNASKGAEFTLDITETETTRKIGASTRHSVRGQKDDVRSMLETQANVIGGSSSASLYENFVLFLSEQKDSLIGLM